MKLSIKLLVHLLLLNIATTLSVYGKSAIEIFNEANKFYMDESFEKAAESYEKLISLKKVSAEIYFNLGNAYYKSGNTASAILNYERALRLKSSDPDILYNLKIANLNTIDKIEPVPQVFYEKWWENFVNDGLVSTRAIMVIIFLWLTFALAAAYLFSGKVFVRKMMFFSTLAMFLCAAFTWNLTHLQHKHLSEHKAAVVFSENVYVKSSPDEKSANLFMLHSGTRLEVLDTLQGWKKVRIANGNEGWIVDHSIEII